MTGEATLNVRFPGALQELKKRGDAVLAREGISTSQAVRGLYRYLDETQRVPSWLLPQEDPFEARRALMKSYVGIAPLREGEDLDDLRRERLAPYDFGEPA